MMRLLASLGLVAVSILVACGGNVVLDAGAGGSAGSGGGTGAGGAPGVTTGSAGSTGAGGAPAACPSSSSVVDFMDIVGMSCAPPDQVCTFNDGCGICSLSCIQGVWQATNGTICPPAPPTC